MAGLGLLLAFAVSWWLARRDGTRWPEVIATLAWSVVAAVVGARAWSLIAWWCSDPEEVRWIWDPLDGAGYASAGGLVAAAVTLFVARTLFGAGAFRRIVDAVVPAGFAGLALARLGCVFERCDPGRPTALFGVLYPDGASLHAFGAYITFPTLILVAIGAFRPADGRRAVFVAMGYAVVRFVAEFARDAPAIVHAGHAVAVGVALVAGGWWWFDRRHGREV